jgi:O-antigen/teichoic acid export membrane protein
MTLAAAKNVEDAVSPGIATQPISRRAVWLRKGALAILDQGLLSGANFVISILLARWLTRDEYGAYAMAFSVFILLSGFHNAFFLEPMSIFGPESYLACLAPYIRKLYHFHFAFTLVLAAMVAACIIVLPYFTPDANLPRALWGVAIAVPLILFYWTCRRAAYLHFSPGLAVSGSATYFISSLVLVLLMKHWLSPFLGFVIQAVAAIPAAILILGMMRSGRGAQPSLSSGDVLRKHWRYGRWVMGSTIVTWVSGYGYYVLVGALLPMQDVAVLRSLRNLTEPCYRAMAAIILLVLPWASSRFAQEGVAGLKRRVRQLNLLFGGCAFAYFALICAFGNRVMNLLYSGRYNSSAHLLLLATAPLVLIAGSLGSEIAVQVMQSPSEVFLAYGISGALTLVLGVALTHYWGLTGGLVSILLSSASIWIVLTLRCQRRLRMRDTEIARDPLPAEVELA